jgi:hypothetical protein
MLITHNLETLSNKQKSDLRLAQTLMDNLNPLRPSHKVENHLSYDGTSFTVTQLGYSHKFLVDDINLAIQDDYQKHKKFISKTIQKEFENYDLGANNYDNLKSFSNMFIEGSVASNVMKNFIFLYLQQKDVQRSLFS